MSFQNKKVRNDKQKELKTQKEKKNSLKVIKTK